MAISHAQCRAARALIDMTQQELAAASGVSLGTILNLENGQRSTIAANLAAIQRALEAAGVEFTAEGGVGPGLRLREPPASSK